MHSGVRRPSLYRAASFPGTGKGHAVYGAALLGKGGKPGKAGPGVAFLRRHHRPF